MGNDLAQDLPKIGFLYHYPTLDHPTDKFRLDIFVSSIPTEKHFDVLRVYLLAKNPNGDLEQMKITHPWHYGNSFRVCAGKVILEDRYGKKEEAFCFGGQLSINVKDKLTECVLVSPVPILEITENNPSQVMFIQELEIILAEYRADNLDSHDFELHLCNVDPLNLYLACLNELIEKFKHMPNKDENYLRFLSYLHKEEYRLEAAGLIKSNSPGLETLFK